MSDVLKGFFMHFQFTQPGSFNFKGRVSKELKRQGFTQKAMAEHIQINEKTFSDYMLAKTHIPLIDAIAVARKLSVSVYWMCGLTDERLSQGEQTYELNLIQEALEDESKSHLSSMKVRTHLIDTLTITDEDWEIRASIDLAEAKLKTLQRNDEQYWPTRDHIDDLTQRLSYNTYPSAIVFDNGHYPDFIREYKEALQLISKQPDLSDEDSSKIKQAVVKKYIDLLADS